MLSMVEIGFIGSGGEDQAQGCVLKDSKTSAPSLA
jgi:hypothetical protein